MFQDRVRVHVEAGRGGDGSISFRREKYVPRGGPDGGDGGNGGDVVLVAEASRRDLGTLARSPHVKAGRGRHGEGGGRRGADGATRTVPVPVGTQVFDDEGRLVADLAHAGARVVVAAGGRGGGGNRRFVNSVRQAPRVAEPGEAGEVHWVELRLKLLADAALVGFPNAGKSSLLAAISNARPKVADYPFTTLAPVLGTVEGPDARQVVVADVPGLLEGASEGVGLGDEFLAHLERARLLVHVIDAAVPDPAARFEAIDRELSAYGAGLAERPQIVVLNKVDLAPDADLTRDDPRVLARVRTSTLTGEGIGELVRTLFEHVPVGALPHEDELADYLVYRPRSPRRRHLRVLRSDRGWLVVGDGAATASEDELEAALLAAGARPGDVATVGDETFEVV